MSVGPRKDLVGKTKFINNVVDKAKYKLWDKDIVHVCRNGQKNCLLLRHKELLFR